MLTMEELAAMQETREANLPDSCRGVDITYPKNARGEPTATPVYSAAFACRVAPLGANERERVVLDRLGVAEAWKVVVPRAVSIELQDQIEVTIDGVARILEVVSAPGSRSYELAHSWVGVEVK